MAIDSHNALGVVLLHMREFPKAVAHLEKALALSQHVNGKESLQNVVFLRNLGMRCRVVLSAIVL